MNTGGAADLAGTFDNRPVSEVQKLIYLFKSLAAQTHTARITVVDEYRRPGELFMIRIGNAAHVVAVAQHQ